MNAPAPIHRTSINRLVENQTIDQPFQAADKQMRVNRQGSKYLLMKLTDRSGTIAAMMWNVDERAFESFNRGDYIHCRGRAQVHNGNLQLIVNELWRLEPDDVDLSEFERFDSSEADRLLERLRELLTGFRNVHLRRISMAFLDNPDFVAKLRIAPAAVSNHHAFPGGLIKHTVDMIELALLIGPRYPQLDTDLLACGAFLHDLGKVEELSSGGEIAYTDRGQLVGHIVIGAQMLDRVIARLNQAGGDPIPDELYYQLTHLILSHHGQLEYGSPKLPSTLEGIALHQIDNLDAKLAAAISVIESDIAADGNWTNYSPSMGRKLWKTK